MQQDCPIKDLGFQEGDDLSKGVNFDDVTLSFDCGNYELLGSSQQSHPIYSSEDKELDCLVMEKNSSVSGSNSHVETSLEVLVTSFNLQLTVKYYYVPFLETSLEVPFVFC